MRDHALRAVNLESDAAIIGLTPAEIEAASGLSRPTVGGLIDRFQPVLVAQDQDGGPMPKGTSGKARRWAIDPNIGVTLGVEVTEEAAQVVAGDLYGRILDRRPISRDEIADETLQQATCAIRDLLSGRPATDVAGVGISLAAPVDHGRGIASLSSDGPWSDWQLMQVRGQLRARLGWEEVPFRLENDANLSALAEYIWGAGRPSPVGDRAPYKNIVYVEWSRGVGTGLIFAGDLYRGDGLAGELGHTIINPKLDAPRCSRCGGSGCLETVIGWETIVRRVPQYTKRGALHEDDLKTVLQQAHAPGQERDLLAAAAQTLGFVLGPVINMLNPELVIIGGDVGSWGFDVIRAPLLESLTRFTMRPALAYVTVVGSKLGEQARVQGTLAIVLRASSRTAGTLTNFFLRRI